MIGFAAVAFAACSNHDFETYTPEQMVKAEYDAKFIAEFGQPNPSHNWGFGVAGTRAFTRSFAAPACPDIDQPYDEAWVTNYLATAQEPTATNTTNNDANAGLSITTAVILPQAVIGDKATKCIYNRDQVTAAELNFYDETFSALWAEYQAAPVEHSSYNNEVNYVTVNNAKIDKFMAVYDAVVTFAGEENVSDWLSIQQMPQKGAYGNGDFVLNFKITGTYTGTINVAQSEGYAVSFVGGEEVYGDRLDPFLARTIVVTGTWNINANQRMGSGSLIVIANGGTVNIQEGVEMQTVNQARIVVLPGGTLSGAGYLEVSNGNGVGGENYNGGTINIGRFNNNFGKFYNYGTFIANSYNGGAKESNFYNHSLVKITNFVENTPNARVFNACQFYIINNARIRNYEGVGGSALIVGGQLHTGFSGDGTNDPTSVGLAAGALVKAGSLWNNGTSWSGPTDGGYAVLKIGQFDYMNWVDGNPAAGGYFANNIYLVADNLLNVPEGNGMQRQTDDGSEYYTQSQAKWKFENVVANCTGNGNVTIAEEGNYEVIPADGDFVLGQAGCTPGFKIKKDDPTPTINYTGRIMAEDLTPNESSDWDFNDVVFDYAFDYAIKDNKAYILLQAAGGTLPLNVGGTLNSDGEVVGGYEVHAAFGLNNTTTMVNTGAGATHDPVALTPLDNKTYTSNADIQIFVKKKVDGVEKWIEIPGEWGEPAGKFVTDIKTDWVDEFANIKYAWGNFTQWVQNGNGNFVGSGKNALYFDRKTRNEPAPAAVE